MKKKDSLSPRELLQRSSIPTAQWEPFDESAIADASELLDATLSVDAVIRTLEYKYLDATVCDIFRLDEVGILEGHVLIDQGYQTVTDVAASTIPELRRIDYLSEGKAKTIYIAARKTRRLSERPPAKHNTKYVLFDADESIDCLDSRLSSLSVDSKRALLIIDGSDTTEAITAQTIRKLTEIEADVLTIRDRRRHKILTDLAHMDCTAAEFTHRSLSESGSIPAWLTGTHYYREVAPPPELSVPDRYGSQSSMSILGLHRYQPVTKDPDRRSVRLHDFAKKDGRRKYFGKAMVELICRRILRGDCPYDYIVPYPSHDGGYSSPLQFTEGLVSQSTPINYRHLIERCGEIAQQKAQDTELDRWRNAMNSTRATQNLNGESIILLDDICTSGASLYWAGQELLKAGAERVLGLVYGLNTGWGDIKEIEGPGATIDDIRLFAGQL